MCVITLYWRWATTINVPITCGTKARHSTSLICRTGHEAVCEVPATDGSVIFTLKAARTGNTITVTGAGEAKNWTLCLRNVVKVNGLQDGSQAESEQGLVVKPQGNALTITL